MMENEEQFDFDVGVLAKQALVARKNAYAPYSGFAVGAALLAQSGKVYLGANVENAAYSVTNCAERSALFAAISAGERSFVAIAVAGGEVAKIESLSQCTPCGVCRQALFEFTSTEFPVVLAQSKNEYSVTKLGDLLPLAFGPKQVQ